MRLRHIEVFHAGRQAGTVSGAAQVLLSALKAPLSQSARRLVKHLREATEACLLPLAET